MPRPDYLYRVEVKEPGERRFFSVGDDFTFARAQDYARGCDAPSARIIVSRRPAPHKRGAAACGWEEVRRYVVGADGIVRAEPRAKVASKVATVPPTPEAMADAAWGVFGGKGTGARWRSAFAAGVRAERARAK